MSTILRIAAIASLSALAGCAMSIDDTVRGDFSSITPATVPPLMVGNWTGNLGRHLVTIQLQPDGSGVSCGSWTAQNAIQAIKHVDGKIFFQDGARTVVSQAAPESIQLLRAYSGDESSSLLRDPQLEKSSPECAKLIRG